MLVLSRLVGERIVIGVGSGDTATVEICDVEGDKVRLGIIAPEHVRVDREEVHIRRKEGKG